MNFLQATRLMRGISAVAASYAGRFGTQAFEAIPPRAGICEFNERGFRFFASKSKSVSGRRGSAATVETKKAHTAPRRLTFNVGKSAGRNSQGRITAFHRGGGSKRLYRVIDVKRNTPAMGIVERIEYDPNRSSRIALVRWTEGMQPCIQKKSRTAQVFAPPSEILEPKEATIRGVFSFLSISGEMNQKNAACLTPAPNPVTVVVGLPTATNTSSKGNFAGNGSEQRRTSVKDVFLSAFSSPKAMDKTAGCAFNSSFNLPRVAVAGAKPSFAAPLLREKNGEKKTFSLSEIQKFKPNSIYWTHRMKRKAAVSWQSL